MKVKTILGALTLAVILGSHASYAQTRLIAVGQLPGADHDHAGQTSKPLENGVDGNLLGGMGSGLAHAGDDRFVAIPDRGPNAVPYNSCVDDTASYITRFHEIRLRLTANSGSGLPFVLTPFLDATKLMSSATPLSYGDGTMCPVPPDPLPAPLSSGAPKLNNRNTFYFTGRSDNFDIGNPDSLNPANGRLDPESVRVANDGKSIFISDEYGPYVYQFDRNTGTRIRVFTLPSTFAISYLSSQGAEEINHNTVGRITNKGMEGLAITPDGSTLVGIMQSGLAQDGGDSKGQVVRIATIDIASGVTTHQYAYQTNLTEFSSKKTAVSDIVAVNNHVFLVDERDSTGLGFPRDGTAAEFKRLYLIDLDDAADVSDVGPGDGRTVAQRKTFLKSKATKKYLFMDVLENLQAALGVAADHVPAKLEGIAFGDDVAMADVTKHTAYVVNDNDFDSSPDNPNQFFVFAFSDDDLANAKASDNSTLGREKAAFEPQIIQNK